MRIQHGEQLSFSTPVDPKKTAVLVVDLQYAEVSDETRSEHPDYVERIYSEVVPNVQRIIAAARAVGTEVMFTTIESLTKDGRDRSQLHKLAKLHVPKGSLGGKVLEEIAPVNDEILLTKTGSGVFNTTMLEYVLTNMGIEAVVVVGVLTDQCIDMCVRDGSDRGFFMICVNDACTTYSVSRHENALATFGPYCRISTTEQVLHELSVPASDM